MVCLTHNLEIMLGGDAILLFNITVQSSAVHSGFFSGLTIYLSVPSHTPVLICTYISLYVDYVDQGVVVVVFILSF